MYRLDRNLALEFVRITEAAAIASARWTGRGNKHKADDAAVKIMRKAFNNLDINGKIVIGEGERDNAPMLYIGEKVGTKKGLHLDIAVDPLECTNSVAFGKPNAMSVLAASPKGKMLHAPDTYMDKIAVGPESKGKINLDWDVSKNIEKVAKAKNLEVEDVNVILLNRSRHEKLIKEIRNVGARITIIDDGDVSGAIASCLPESDVDILLGIGAAPEGVLAASAIKCLGGEIQGRLKFRNEDEKERAKKMGIKKLNKKLSIDNMVKGKISIFAATGVSSGPLLKGVDFTSFGAQTHSIVLRSKTGEQRFIKTNHHFTGKVPKI